MEEGNSTSLKEGNEIAEPKRWTKDLNGHPTFTYEILTKHLSKENSGAGSQKHKKLGYQIFKDKYVGEVEFKEMLSREAYHASWLKDVLMLP